MNTKSYIKERYEQLKGEQHSPGLDTIRESGFAAFSQMGIPTVKHEEWKYTRISPLFDKDFLFGNAIPHGISADEFKSIRLAGANNANELVFVNGIFTPELSVVRSGELVVLPLEQAAENEYADVVKANLGHSSRYLKDGLNAMNTALLEGGIFIHIPKGKIASHPVYIYNIADARS